MKKRVRLLSDAEKAAKAFKQPGAPGAVFIDETTPMSTEEFDNLVKRMQYGPTPNLGVTIPGVSAEMVDRVVGIAAQGIAKRVVKQVVQSVLAPYTGPNPKQVAVVCRPEDACFRRGRGPTGSGKLGLRKLRELGLRK